MLLRLPAGMLLHPRATCFKWQYHAEVLKTYATGKIMKPLPTQSHNCSISERLKMNSSYSRFVICRDFQEKDEREFYLMKMPHVCKRDVTRLVNNWKSFLRIILKYDEDFRPKLFLVGSHQAILKVSKCISAGNFRALHGLLTAKAIREVKRNVEKLSSDQRDLIAVNEAEILHQFIFDVHLKESPLLKEPWAKGWNEIIPAVTAEIFVVMEGRYLPGTKTDADGLTEKTDKFFCNYKFERTYDVEGYHSGWIITQLNHFLPAVDY